MSNHPANHPTPSPERKLDGFLWNRLHISSGAALMFVVMFIFLAAVYKIDNDNLSKSKRVTEGICKVVAGANKNVGQQQARIRASIERYDEAAAAERRIASVWRYAKRQQPSNTPPSQVKLVNKLIDSTDALADQDKSFADDLRVQLKAAVAFQVPGCER